MTFNSTICKWDILKPLQPKFLETVKMIAIYIGDTGDKGDCALLLTYSGQVYVVGKSTVGCLGQGDITKTDVPLQLKNISEEIEGVSVCGKSGDALAYTRKGKIFVWGANSNEAINKFTTFQLSDIGIVDARCAGGNYLVLFKNGKIFQWRGIVCNASSTLTRTPTLISVNEKIVAIDCGYFNSLALTENGEVYVWGKNYSNLHHGYTLLEVKPCKMTIPGETVTKVVCSCYQNLILTNSEKIFTWGKNDFGLGDGNAFSTSPLQVGTNIARFVDIAMNNNNTCAAVTNLGAIYVWGNGGNMTPKYADVTELHEVFAKYRPSSYLLKSRISDSIDIESFTGIAEQLKACFDNEENSDLTIIVDSKKIYLHRFMLNLRSSYFQAHLQEKWTEKNQREIELKSFNYEAYKSYFWYLYSGEVKSPIDNLVELYNLANAYDENNLKLGIEKLMKRNLSYEKMALQCCKVITNDNPKRSEGDADSSSASLMEKTEKFTKRNNKKRSKIRGQYNGNDFTSNHEDADEGIANLKEKLVLLEINLAKQQQENENLKALLQQQENADKST